LAFQSQQRAIIGNRTLQLPACSITALNNYNTLEGKVLQSLVSLDVATFLGFAPLLVLGIEHSISGAGVTHFPLI
jgi:hypothetical protein